MLRPLCPRASLRGSVGDLDRLPDPPERRFVLIRLRLRRYADDVEQAAVPQLRRRQGDVFALAGDFRDVAERRRQPGAPADAFAAGIAGALQIRVRAREAVEQLLRVALQIAAAPLGDANLHAMGERGAAVVAREEAAVRRVGDAAVAVLDFI